MEKPEMVIVKPKAQIYLKRFNWFLHAIVSLMNIATAICGIIFVITAPSECAKNRFVVHGYHHKEYFFSLWVTVCHHIYFGIYSAIDIIDIYYSHKPTLLNAKEILHFIASYLLFTIIFPLSLLIFLLFWSVYLWNREIIYPSIIDEMIPPWINHALHTFPVPLSIIYMLTTNKKEPSRLSSLSGLVIFLAIYSYIFFNIHATTGQWIYLMFEYVTPMQKNCILSSSIIGAIIFHFLGYKLNNLIICCKKNATLLFC